MSDAALEATLERLRRATDLQHAEVRLASHRGERLELEDEQVTRLDRETGGGVAVRVLVDGAWGFAALPGQDEETSARAADAALEVARAAARHAGGTRVELAEEAAVVGSWQGPALVDPLAVPLERKLHDLGRAVAAARAAASGPRAADLKKIKARFICRHDESLLGTTSGTRVRQHKTLTGGALQVITERDGERGVRSYPMDLDGGVRQGGYEVLAALDLPGHAADLSDEALALTTAPPCPAGSTTLLLDTPQLALQIHESCGHPTEGDRALGEELSLAGHSFLTPDRLGRLRYGSTLVNLTADARVPGGLGTFGWDDEGVPARRARLISRGIFVGYLSSREVAARLGLGRSAGCLRAGAWDRPPIIRMTNVLLEPDPRGPADLEALIADTDDGILMAVNKSWSIDDLRLDFQFGCESAWEIKHGRRTRLLSRPRYRGRTPRFWAGCDAICGPGAFEMWGFLSCGKGDPIQLQAVGHGTAPARFRNVEVGHA
jgi:TldD protein